MIIARHEWLGVVYVAVEDNVRCWVRSTGWQKTSVNYVFGTGWDMALHQVTDKELTWFRRKATWAILAPLKVGESYLWFVEGRSSLPARASFEELLAIVPASDMGEVL